MNDLAPEARPAVLEIETLSASYAQGAQPVLNHVSLCIAKGEAVGVIGESGSGKTTLAKTILGSVKPNSGKLRFAGKDLTRLNPFELRRFRRSGVIQYVFQDPLGSLDPQWPVHRSIEEPLLIGGTADAAFRHQAVLRAAGEVGFPLDLLDRLPRNLSGGQRQRVAIARALVHRPQLLISDEPVSALDSAARVQVLELFASLREKLEISQIFISHDLGSVAALVDRVLVLHRGRIVEEGHPGDVIANPQHEYTQELVRAAPRLRI